MFRKVFAVIMAAAIALVLSACGGDESESITTLTDTIELEVGENTRMQFSTMYNPDDIVLVFSDDAVCMVEKDSSSASTVNYKVTAVNPGVATFYVESKDGAIKSNEVTVRVDGLIVSADEGNCPAEQLAQHHSIEKATNDSQRRRELRITVPVDVESQATDDDITRFMKWLAERQDKAFDFPKLYIYMFNTEDDWTGGYTIAMCHYTPETGECEISIHDPVTREALRQ